MLIVSIVEAAIWSSMCIGGTSIIWLWRLWLQMTSKVQDGRCPSRSYNRRKWRHVVHLHSSHPSPMRIACMWTWIFCKCGVTWAEGTYRVRSSFSVDLFVWHPFQKYWQVRLQSAKSRSGWSSLTLSDECGEMFFYLSCGDVWFRGSDENTGFMVSTLQIIHPK